MSKLKEIFNQDIIDYLKNNKHEITVNLLEEIRSYGNEGKHIALQILDLPVDDENYYLDAFGNRISFNGNRRLKKQYTRLNLSEIHLKEIERCAKDIKYFKDNYVKIKTKNGVNFPELRDYQNRFIELLSSDVENIVALLGRQSAKSTTTAIYLTHLFLFQENLNIGIVANRGAQAREFLANIKNIFIELPIWLQTGINVWNKGSIESENKTRILTDVPGPDAFRGYTMNCLVIDEAAFIRTTIFEEFADSIFPSQSALAWKKNIIISTANGMNHFYDLVNKAKSEDVKDMTFFTVDWREVPRYKTDGSTYDPDEFRDSIIKKYGLLYWKQNYECEFLGSSHTLISSEKLKIMQPKKPEEILGNKLKIYEHPQKDHKYIMAVDPAKDGTDAFAIQIVDITTINFKQVAAANLQVDYLLMPEYLYEWGKYYNTAFLIIENNEGAGQSIADQLKQTYEYENLYYDFKQDSNVKNLLKAKKIYPGFRTTSKSRKQILQTMKLFIENDKLEIVDKTTIEELKRFIYTKNKFQADDGCKDDMVLALALVFAPFCNVKNFIDMEKVIKNIYFEDNETYDFTELVNFGSFDDGVEEDLMYSENKQFDEFIYIN